MDHLPDIVAFFSLVIGIVSLSLVIFIFRIQSDQSKKIEESVEITRKFIEIQKEFEKSLTVEYAKQLMGLFQIIRSIGRGLREWQEQLQKLDGKYDEQSVSFTKNARTWFEEDRKYCQKLVMESRFATEPDLILKHFGKDTSDDFKKIIKMISFEDVIMMQEKFYETWLKDWFGKAEDIADELYSKIKKFLPEDEIEKFELWEKNRSMNSS